MIEVGVDKFHEECPVVGRGDIDLTTTIEGVIIHSCIEILEFAEEGRCSGSDLGAIGLEDLDKAIEPLEISGCRGGVTLEDEDINLAVDLSDESVNEVLLEGQGLSIGVCPNQVFRPLADEFLGADSDKHLNPRSNNLPVGEGHAIDLGFYFTDTAILESRSDLKIVEMLFELHSGLDADAIADAASDKTEVLEEQVTILLHISREGCHDKVCSRHDRIVLGFCLEISDCPDV